MSDIVITYEVLYELLRREKTRQELQTLDKNFLQNVITYLQEKQAILKSQKSKDSIFKKEVSRTAAQIQNIKKIIKELYEKREQKITHLAILSARTNETPDLSAMLPEEKELYLNLKQKLSKQRLEFLENILNAKQPKLEPEIEPKAIKTSKIKSTKLIRIKHAIPQFVGNDLHIYGPFLEEDIANLPIRVADVLIIKNRAEELK